MDTRKNKKILETSLFIFSFITSIICVAINFSQEIQGTFFDLWLIPTIYSLLVFFSILFWKDDTKFFLKTFYVVSLFKYSFTILLYYIEGTNIYLYNKSLVIQLLLTEMVALFFVVTMLLGRKKQRNSEKPDNMLLTNQNTKIIGFGAAIGLLCLLIIIIKQPELLYKFLLVNSGVSSNLTGLEQLIYNVAMIITTIVLLRLIKYKLKWPDIAKIFFSLIIIAYMTLNLASSFNGNISRWNVLFNFIIFASILINYYANRKKIIIGIVFVSLIILIPVLSVIKFGDSQTQSNITISNVSEDAANRVSFRSFDAYFSGPLQTSLAIETYDIFHNDINLETFMNDIFRNFPLLNHYLSDKNYTSTYYNVTRSNDWSRTDFIIPMIGQGYIYLKEFFAFIFSAIFIILSYIADQKIQNSKDEIEKYIHMRTTLVFGICIILNFTIMFQFIWQTFLPLYIIQKLNIHFYTKRSIHEKNFDH